MPAYSRDSPFSCAAAENPLNWRFTPGSVRLVACYEDPAFFRRLFKRTTGLAPGAYRNRFRIPEFARP